MTLAVLVLRLVVCILALPMFLLNLLGVWSWVCKKWFPYFLKRFTVMYNEQMASRKRELFSNLQEFAGPSGKLSLLEVGCGTGANFKFYPPGCRVTCIDPNPNFEKFLFKSVAENRHLQFERFVVAAGENMHQVADGSVDVVVCTLVLCSVNNQEKILREVHRVLRPVSDKCEGWLAAAIMSKGGPISFGWILEICLFMYMSILSLSSAPGRGRQILLQMVVSLHVVAGN
ncbi:thiol S-methyltransferase TMT1A-like isoform X1 [Arvicanthis niloticus]|uniref:thiol S-methyltransferase TMT1A-like isoform X1 n=1 Tax=Arvicanthis niloticus TaxID=61156 RepID=UPI00403D281C